MRRREFITLLGGAAAAWPLPARAQQAMPVIGFLGIRSPGAMRFCNRVPPGSEGDRLCRRPERGDRISLGRGQLGRLPALAAELVRRQVAVIARYPLHIRRQSGDHDYPHRFRRATTQSSWVLSVASIGRAATSLERSFHAAVAGKRLELLRDLIPTAAVSTISYCRQCPVSPGNRRR